MNLRKIIAHNAFNMRHREFNLKPGVTGIVGRNGRGKTSFLYCCELLFSGQCQADGNKVENVLDLAAADEPSYVSGVFTHKGHRFERTCGLRHCKSSLRVDGGQTIYGETAISKELAKHIPAWDLIADYAIVHQHKMFEFISKTLGKRSAAFAQLFGTDQALKVHDLITKKLSKLEIPQRSDEIDSLARRIADSNEELSRLRRRVKRYKDLVGVKLADHPAAKVIARRKEYKAACKRYVDAYGEQMAMVDEIRTLESHAEQHAEAVELWKERVDKATVLLERKRKSEGDARVAEQQWLAYDRAKADRDAWSSQVAALGKKKQAAYAALPARPARYIEPSARELAAGTRAKKAAEVAWGDKFIETFAAASGGKNSRCPTCGNVMKNLAVLVREAAEARDAAKADLDSIDDLIAATRDYDAAIAANVTKMAELNRDIDRLREPILPTPPAHPRDKAKATLDEIAEATKQFNAASKSLKASEKDEAATNATLKTQRKNLDALKSKVKAIGDERGKLKTTKEEADAARVEYEQVRERINARGELRGKIGALKRSIESDTSTRERLIEEAARGDRLRSKVSHLQAVRSVLKTLPDLVSAGHLELIQEGINATLSSFQPGFSVSSGEDLSFVANFDTGSVQRSARLSGGQMTLLGMAFWVEINALFANSIGFLAMDEPTHFLDVENVDLLAKAIDQLKRRASDNGSQIFIVTHERKFARVFDHTVTFR